MLFAPNRGRFFSLVKWLIISFLCCWLIGLASASADDTADRRIQISLPVFPRIVAVDNEFKQKLLPGNKVLFVFLYEYDREKAESLAESLQNKLTNVAGMEFSTAIALVGDQLVTTAPVPTAMFAAESFSEQTFAAALEYAVKQHRLLFSPYVGDVERGAMAGIAIGSRVRPYFNMKSLKRAAIDINAVLLNLSKRYE
jgi:hypothetical protein